MNNDCFKFRVWDNDAGEYIDDGALLDGRTGRISGTGNYTIEQCTGVHDLNGDLIYEGDIIRYAGTMYVPQVVAWNPKTCHWVTHPLDNERLTASFCDDFLPGEGVYIIGNIHKRGYVNADEQRKQHKPTIYAIDFDGTIVENTFPKIGNLKPEAERFIRELRARGDKWILYTMREGLFLDEAREFLAKCDLLPDAVNDNLPEMCEFYGNNPRKIFAHVYIDDHNAGGLCFSPPQGKQSCNG